MKKSFLRALAVIAAVVLSAGTAALFSACGNKDKYSKISFNFVNKQPDQVLDITLSSVTEDSEGNHLYVENAATEGFVYITVVCEYGFEPSFSFKANGVAVDAELDRDATQPVSVEVTEEDKEPPYKFLYKLDTRQFSGDTVLSISGNVVTAHYKLAFSFTEKEQKSGNYEDFTLTVDGVTYTFAQLWEMDAEQGGKAIYPKFNLLLAVKCKIDGKTFVDGETRQDLLTVRGALISVTEVGMDEVQMKDDTITYLLIPRGTVEISLSFSALNDLYNN